MKMKAALAVVIAAALSTPTWAEEEKDPEAQRLANAKAEVDLEQAKLNLERSKWAVPASGQTGAVETKEGAGKAEQLMLSTAALRAAAADLVKAMEACPVVVLYPGDEKPDLSRWQTFQFQMGQITDELDSALSDAPEPKNKYLKLADPVSLVTAGAALFSYFKSDYSAGGTDIPTDNNKFGAILAQQLITKQHAVYFAADYTPDLAGAIKTSLKAGDNKADKAAKRSRSLKADAAATKKQGEKAEIDAAVARLDAAVTAYRVYVSSLGAATTTGELPLSVINRQLGLSQLAPQDQCALNFRVNNAAGTNYSKKTLISTLFSTTPFYVGAAVDVSYRVWDDHGRVVAAGVVSKNSDFLKSRKVLEKNADATSSLAMKKGWWPF